MALLMRLSLLISALFISVGAHAATFTVKEHENGATYIEMNGTTQRGDVHRLDIAILEAKQQLLYTVTDAEGVETHVYKPFSNQLLLSGPGGEMVEGIRVALTVWNAGIDTFVEDRCASACALIWMAGKHRDLGQDGMLLFHPPYSSSVHQWDRIKDTDGWHGVQDEVNRTTLFFMSYMHLFGIAEPATLFYHMAHNSGTDKFSEITRDELWVLGTESNRPTQ